MKFRIKILSIFIPLSLFLCFMSNTYSRYVADTTGNLKMSFAQWQILVNTADITSNSNSSVVLTPVINKNKYVESNKLAPSSSGYFDISIDPSNVDVAFNYYITLDVLNKNIPDLIITKYAILDSNYTEDETIIYKNIENNTIHGSLDLENVASTGDDILDNKFEPFIVRVCFEWYEGLGETMSDELDTAFITDAKNNNLEINATIRFEQKIESIVDESVSN